MVTDAAVHTPSGPRTRQSWTRLGILLAPFTMVVLAIPVVIAFAEAGWSVWAIVFGMLAYGALYVLASLAASVMLVLDARRRRELDSDWQPVAWKYLLGGAAVFGLVSLPLLVSELLSALALPMFDVGLTVESLVGTVIGWVVTVLLASPVVAGPVYLWRGRRRGRR